MVLRQEQEHVHELHETQAHFAAVKSADLQEHWQLHLQPVHWAMQSFAEECSGGPRKLVKPISDESV